jgi:hypothetical protein
VVSGHALAPLLLEAMPCLSRSEAVHVLGQNRDGGRDGTLACAHGVKMVSMVGALPWHGLNGELDAR